MYIYILHYVYIYICFCEFNMIQYQFNLGIKLPTVAAVDSANLHEWLSADWSLASEHGRIHGKNVVFCFTFTVLPLSWSNKSRQGSGSLPIFPIHA